jgi:hypothetical protein
MPPRAPRRRETLLLLLLGLPALSYAPALVEGRLLGPGDGAHLHYPMKAAVWEAWRRGELPSWNHDAFLGTPLLAAYRPAALHPLVVALSALPSFAAFQVLVLGSLGLAGALVFLYVRRLGGHDLGAFVAGVCWAMGPYFVNHLDDAPTLLAAPALPLVLLACEAFLRGIHRSRWIGRAAGLAAALALLIVSGSPEAVRAGGLLLLARAGVALLTGPRVRRAGGRILVPAAAGLLLGAPQLLPTLDLAREAGRQITRYPAPVEAIPGAPGLVLRYVSHTPAAALAAAALPLLGRDVAVRALFSGLALTMALQWGRSPLLAPGTLPIVFDLTLALLGGLALSAQWRARRLEAGRRLRMHFLAACLASAAALSVAAATLGPLPESLAAAVGILALALILYFSNAAAEDPVVAGVWLLPLVVSFLLQPFGRRLFVLAPTSAELSQGTGTRQAVERAMGAGRADAALALVWSWPREEALDLAHGNLAGLVGRRSANGYDPLVPVRTRVALGNMSPGGTLPEGFAGADPQRLELLGIRWLLVPASSLRAEGSKWGAPLQATLEAGRPLFLSFPVTQATEVRLISSLAEATEVRQDEVVAAVHVRLATGRTLAIPVRAGVDTAEWAHDRRDVKPVVRHHRAPVAESWPVAGEAFSGHHYQAALDLHARYFVDAVRLEGRPGPGVLRLVRLALVDGPTGRWTPLSKAAVFAADTGRFREVADTPRLRLYELPNTAGYARVVDGVREVADHGAALDAIASPRASGVDPRRTAVVAAPDAASLPPGARASRAQAASARGGRMDVRAEGPGLLVVAEGWDPGWRARLDGRDAAVHRVNAVQLGVALGPGWHRVTFSHRPRGFVLGSVLAGATALVLALLVLREGRPGV